MDNFPARRYYIFFINCETCAVRQRGSRRNWELINRLPRDPLHAGNHCAVKGTPASLREINSRYPKASGVTKTGINAATALSVVAGNLNAVTCLFAPAI